jgi:hypothetical protein
MAAGISHSSKALIVENLLKIARPAGGRFSTYGAARQPKHFRPKGLGG